MSSLFLRACHGETVERVPVWLMRQAGRYQKSYRAVRERVSFLELCRSPDLIAQVTTAPIDQFGFDAAILFSDILIALPAMGLDLTFGAGGDAGSGPHISNPVRSSADVSALRPVRPSQDLPFVAAAIRSTRAALEGRVPLIGFVGGPFTVASYVIGGGGHQHDRAKQFFYSEPSAAHQLLDKLTDAAIVQLRAQIDAGAEAVQVFESWSGELSREDLEIFLLPRLARIAGAVKGVPRILFASGSAANLEAYSRLGFDMLSIDWKIQLAEVRRRLLAAKAPTQCIQGNLDPVLLLGPEPLLLERTGQLLGQTKPFQNYIFNLGHGILPGTPESNVRALVEAVHAWKPTET